MVISLQGIIVPHLTDNMPAWVFPWRLRMIIKPKVRGFIFPQLNAGITWREIHYEAWLYLILELKIYVEVLVLLKKRIFARPFFIFLG